MSETSQKETEYVTGSIEGITQKGPDKWQVAVLPEGAQYAKNLWTKDSELVAALAQKIGSHGAFVCNVSHWTNNEGKAVRSLWIDSLSDAAQATVNSPSPPAPPTTASGSVLPQPGGLPGATSQQPEGMTPEKWDAKERRDYRSRAWAQTLGAFTHTISVNDKPEDVFKRLQPFQRAVFTDVCQSFAYPVIDDDENIPFG